MARQNKESNDWTVSLLNIQLGDRVLEVGFGPGVAIKAASQRASNGFVAGIDFSDVMVQQASRLNASGIRAGRVELKNADVSSIPYNDASFDKVFAVNVIYLWPELPKVVGELKRVLKPGGLLALYLAPPELIDKLGLRKSSLFTLHKVEGVVRVLGGAGFARTRIETRALSQGMAKRSTGLCVLAEK